VRVVVLACLTACSFHEHPADIVDDAPARDGPGRDSLVIDAPADGSGGGSADSDGDTIVDSADNCPTVPNTDQRDWDGDHHGDACDHCPHLASATDPDADGDGVGDACDPRPSTAGDAIVLWDGFYDAAGIAGWADGGTGGTGTWTVTGGVLEESATNPNQFASLYAPTTYQHVYVATSATVGSWNPMATIGVCNGWDGTHFDCCNINTVNAAPSPVGEAQRDLAQKVDATLGAVTTGQTIDIVENMATTNECTFRGTVIASATPYGQAGKVILYTGHTSASFRYLFVVTIGT
jgi:hypothetical protein